MSAAPDKYPITVCRVAELNKTMSMGPSPLKLGNPGQVPSCREGGQQRSANNDIVVKENYSGLTSAGFEDHEIRIVIAVKICCRYQFPTGG